MPLVQKQLNNLRQLKPGDKVVSIEGHVNVSVTVERNEIPVEPPKSSIILYKANREPSNSEYAKVARENGGGYWHPLEDHTDIGSTERQIIGVPWVEFVTTLGVYEYEILVPEKKGEKNG